MPPIGIDPLYIATSRLVGLRGNQDITSATAFFWTDNGRTFVVTNKHVILGDDFANPRPLTSIRLRCHTTANLNVSNDIDVSLFNGSSPIWLEHNNARVDVVVIPAGPTIFAGLAIHSFSSASLPMANLVIGPGEPLAIIGYPLGFYDQVNNLPVVRSASLASAYRVPFNGLPMFITDAKLHRGTSGAPVVFIARGSWVTTEAAMNVGPLPPILLGINSSTWPVTPDEPLNLNTAWFSSLIGDILSNPKTPVLT